MSASVFKPIHIERLRTPTPVDRTYRVCQKARRSLFGPVDHEENKRFVDDELKKQQVNQSKKWNFDFVKEVPLDQEGRYVWTILEVKEENGKKRRTQDDHDISYLYGKPLEEKRENDENMAISPIAEKLARVCKTQTVITDFMVQKKRTVGSPATKKAERPTKIARTIQSNVAS